MLRPLVVLACALLLAPPAAAQEAQYLLHLNDPTIANRYLSVTPNGGLQGNPDYTLEAWVRPISWSGFPTIFGNDYSQSYWLGLSTTGHVRFYPTGGAGSYFESASVVPLNQWTHVAAVYQTGVGARILVNGVLDATTAAITGAVGTNPSDLRIGADREVTATPTYFWQGYLDELRIWDEARSDAQIAANFRIGIGNPGAITGGAYTHFQGGWDFQQGATTYAYDVGWYGGSLSNYNKANYVNGTVGQILTSTPGPPVSDNTALHLAGDNGCAKMPLADGFSNGLTVDAWIAPTRLGVIQTIAGRDFRTSFWLGITATGHVRFYPAGGPGLYFESVGTLAAGTWTHVAATYRPGDATIYLNGRFDARSTAFTAPVGENGLAVWAGADDEAGISGYPYPFEGYLDDVRVSRGVWGPLQVRQRMFQGAEYQPDPVLFTDDTGASCETWYMGFGQGENGLYTVEGPNSALVRSGAPLASVAMGLSSMGLEGYTLSFPIGLGASLPNNDTFSSVGTDLFLNQSATIASTRVFVDAQASDLPGTHLRVRSPAGTWVDLVTPGDANGKDLHTVFIDAFAATLAGGFSPYYHGVRPSQPMSAWIGQNAYGYWRLEISTSTPGASVGLWTWGLQVNDVPLAVAPGTSEPLALENAGAQPVRGSGRLAFTLPADGPVRLTLSDVQGRLRRTLFDGPRTAGRYVIGWNAEGLEPGIYFARLQAGARQSRTLTLTVLR